MLKSNTNYADWWRGAVIYQIYPRSFQDSNSDGIGDFPGIIKRLPHIASLGVDAIWVSPFYTSPMKDFGYDIVDHCAVDKMFGTIEDFDTMITIAHDLGLKVMIDLVLSHTSNQHEWFKRSREDATNEFADWYVWVDAKEDGSPPNNWLSIFGGSCWQWEGRRQQYYMHNFLTSQPDLNYHNPKVQDASLDVARFWLDRKVDGFRFDTCNFFFHDQQLRDNPAIPLKERSAVASPQVNPYNHQKHKYDINQTENIHFWERMRALTNKYDNITTLGEIGDNHHGIELIGDYTRGDARLHMCYSFELLGTQVPTGSLIFDIMERYQRVAAHGWPCLALSNHDVPRHSSRWQLSTDGQICLLALILAIPGSVCLYQGEELGLPESEIAFEEIQDPYGAEFWPSYPGRDGCRTPMVWDNTLPNAGFSDAKPWLPVKTPQSEKALAQMEKNPDAILHLYRVLIDLYQGHEALRTGSLTLFEHTNDTVSFLREKDDQLVFCAFNLSDTPTTVTKPDLAQKFPQESPSDSNGLTLDYPQTTMGSHDNNADHHRYTDHRSHGYNTYHWHSIGENVFKNVAAVADSEKLELGPWQAYWAKAQIS